MSLTQGLFEKKTNKQTKKNKKKTIINLAKKKFSNFYWSK